MPLVLCHQDAGSRTGWILICSLIWDIKIRLANERSRFVIPLSSNWAPRNREGPSLSSDLAFSASILLQARPGSGHGPFKAA